MATTNKNLEQPALNSTNWNTPLNGNFGILDDALGGRVSFNVSGVGTTPVVLTAAQYQCLILQFTGALTANVNYRIPSGIGGQWIISNATTGAYTLTISSGGMGATVVVPQNARRTVYSDGTNIYETDNSVASVGAAGNVAYSDGSGLIGSTALSYSGSILRSTRDDATTSTILPSLRVSRTTSGAGANGIGSAIQFATDNSAGNEVTGGLIAMVADNATATAEAFSFQFHLGAAGAAPVNRFTISPSQLLLGTNPVLTARVDTNTAVQSLAYAGFVANADYDGLPTAGSTYRPDPSGGNFKTLTNAAAFTLAAPTAGGDYTIIVQITNATGAGAITLSGFNRTIGDAFTTTVGHDFFVFITKVNGFTSAVVQALQ